MKFTLGVWAGCISLLIAQSVFNRPLPVTIQVEQVRKNQDRVNPPSCSELEAALMELN